MSSYWGYHLAIDAAGADLSAISSAANITEFAKALVKRIDMVAFGDPQVVRFGSGNKAGYTLVQLIETSNICCHYVEDDGNGGTAFYLDVFSCKPFDNDVVINCCKDFFGSTRNRIHYFVRQA
jgi:S-adenosylmethionine/arginine decarboxylase-like enzyme